MARGGRSGADERLAAELAAGKTVHDAATAAGIADRTAFRRLADHTFKARVAELRSAMVATATGRLVDGMTEAATVLRSLLDSTDEHVRHKAAVKLIELGLKVTELAELEARVNRLEKTPDAEHLLPFDREETKRLAREAAADAIRNYSSDPEVLPPTD